MSSNRKGFVGITTLCASLWLLPAMAHADDRIGGWAMTANGQPAQGFEYSGSCAVALRFSWGLVSTDPIRIMYAFMRNDGATERGPRHFVTLPGGGSSFSIDDSWQLSANVPDFADYHRWAVLNVAIVDAGWGVSKKIPFTLHCQ